MTDALSRQIVTCRYRISALRQLPDARGRFKLGPLAQLEPGTPLEICGDGYNEITVKVKWLAETFFVFRQDLVGQF